ncbi:uncharacterized protein MONBRDRAFT_21824 [Monosiga brevicollis MX1]|uniref:Fibronectin type-III domain-containing protein n=1 Tax=Monosiga brevicollis TaxID=81824 RepID=A9UNQ3_MONBE|nr:uncharacterized protein MONBRDRAFT_21824 [Monosiga brevicollis MX1]EDQ92284.1 predicted protein [Monosiga brevicollis MX1]|eukprot:XP_001742046.1 hypothetical protein [Monosiga brevicollis MX1]
MPAMEPPRDVEAVVLSPTSIKVTWRRPMGLIAYSFRLYVKPQAAANNAWKRVLEGKDEYEYTLTDLEPSTTYEFKVQSFGMAGDGPFSDIITATTKAGAPQAPPRNLRASVTTMDSITVVWEPPAVHPESVQAYRLYFDRAGEDAYVEVELEAASLSYSVLYLRRDTIYRFQICAITDAGEGPLSAIVPIRTKQDARSRFLKGEAQASQEVSGRKAEYIRDMPEEEPEPAVSETAPAAGPQAQRLRPVGTLPAAGDLPPYARQRWKPPKPSTEPTPDEIEAEKQRIEAERREQLRREQRDKMAEKASFFNHTRQQDEQRMLQRTQSLRIQPQTQHQVSAGVGEPRQEASSVTRRDQEWAFIQNQLAADEHAGAEIEADALRSLVDGRELKGLDGTIRGKRHAVRAALDSLTQPAKFESALLQQLYDVERHNQIVLYITSVSGIRSTFSDCKRMMHIFETLNKKVRVKDVQLDARFGQELEERLPGNDGKVPQAFINFSHAGVRKSTRWTWSAS